MPPTLCQMYARNSDKLRNGQEFSKHFATDSLRLRWRVLRYRPDLNLKKQKNLRGRLRPLPNFYLFAVDLYAEKSC